MTSTVTVYQSTDASAPVLLNNDATGAGLIGVLNACLVTGYGSKASAGWSAPYTATGISVFKQASGFNNMCLRVASGTFAGGNYGCIVTGAMSATGTAISNLTNPFPTTAQISTGGVTWLTGASSPAATIASWRLIADGGFFHLDIQTNMTNVWYRQHYMFGDIIPPSTGVADATNTLLLGIWSTNPTSSNSNTGYNYTSGNRWPYYNFGSGSGVYWASGYTQQQYSLPAGMLVANPAVTSNMWARSGMNFPNGIDGGFYLSPVYAFDYGPSGSNYLCWRGSIPGLWVPCHDRPIDDQVIFNGTGSLNGMSFMSILPGGAGQDTRGCAIQISNWR